MIDDNVCADALNIISHQCAELLGKTLSPLETESVRTFVATLDKPLTKADVRGGIAITLLRTKQPDIKSVKYFFGGMREVQESPAADKSGLSEYYVQKAKRAGKIR
jgi:hypothetical protein